MVVEYSSGYAKCKIPIADLRLMFKSCYGNPKILLTKIIKYMYKNIDRGFLDWYPTQQEAEDSFTSKCSKVVIGKNNRYTCFVGIVTFMTLQCTDNEKYKVVYHDLKEQDLEPIISLMEGVLD